MTSHARRSPATALLPAVALLAPFAFGSGLQAQEVSPEVAETVGEQLIGAFSQESPFTPDAPDHLWFDTGDGTWLFLHFDGPLAEAERIIYTGWAVEGVWCAEDQPGPEFTHFHRTAEVGAWDAGHGGATPGEEGYWLKHIAVESFRMPAMMGMPARSIDAGTDMDFMPTRAPSCA